MKKLKFKVGQRVRLLVEKRSVFGQIKAGHIGIVGVEGVIFKLRNVFHFDDDRMNHITLRYPCTRSEITIVRKSKR